MQSELVGDIKIGGSLGCSDHAPLEFTVLKDMSQVKSKVRNIGSILHKCKNVRNIGSILHKCKNVLSPSPLNSPFVTPHPESPAVSLILCFQGSPGSVPW